jgi:hypothetical protein
MLPRISHISGLGVNQSFQRLSVKSRFAVVALLLGLAILLVTVAATAQSVLKTVPTAGKEETSTPVTSRSGAKPNRATVFQ